MLVNKHDALFLADLVGCRTELKNSTIQLDDKHQRTSHVFVLVYNFIWYLLFTYNIFPSTHMSVCRNLKLL